MCVAANDARAKREVQRRCCCCGGGGGLLYVVTTSLLQAVLVVAAAVCNDGGDDFDGCVCVCVCLLMLLEASVSRSAVARKLLLRLLPEERPQERSLAVVKKIPRSELRIANSVFLR